MRDLRKLVVGAALGLVLGVGTPGASQAQAETVLHRGNGAEPETLDVHKSTGVPESYIQMDLFEGLLTSGPDAKPVPGAAEGWTISEDGLVYTFRIRDDAKWSDGTDVTAEDFVHAWRRLVDPATASDYAFFLWPVVNGEAITKGEKAPDELGAEAVDAKTLKVTLRAPTPYFLSAQLHHATYPISKANHETFGEDYLKPGNLVSNGAYMLDEHVPQSYVKAVKNPHFHDAGNVAVDTVFFYATEDIDAEFKRFRAGELDTTYEMPPQQITWAKRNMPEEFRNFAYFGTYFYNFNLNNEPWKSNPGLRKALSLAVDRDILVEKVAQGGELPAYGWVPPGVNGYESQSLDYAGMTQQERDELAKELLADAGYGPDNPLKIEFLYNTSERHKKIAIAVASMWKQKLGIDTTMMNEEWKVFLETRNKKQYKDLARHGWIGDYNDPNSFLELLRSDIGEQNPSAYSNPEFDELMIRAGQEKDAEARMELMQRAEAVMLEDHAILPLYFYTRPHMAGTHVKGWVDNIMNFHPTRYVSIEK
ncbi:MAG TPA: peptide ABC transporter substrate-binding protein [Arenibaculum sp.]|nr:peptide ABC transporter substrate-binding protein [Arenibaculum sp.]